MEATAWHQSENCDRISDLPDNVILHILSFLPIKDCIRTSFLARRWRYLWTFVPTLDFDGLVFSPKAKFVKFVNVVLNRRNSGVQKLFLRFGDYYCDSSHAQRWISAAVSHNVRELAVHYHSGIPFELPICLFTCKSLTVLKLNLNSSTLKLPSSMHLSLLNTLHLKSVTLSDNRLTQKLFSNCPMLKEVVLEDFDLGDLTILHICSPSLERLTISYPKGFYSHFLGHEIRICTPCLLSLKYIGCLGQNICLENMSMLVDAAIYLEFDSYRREQICAFPVINFFRGLSSARILTMSSSSIQFLSVASNLSGQLSTFYNLNYLKLTAAVTEDNIQVINCFLNSAPNLEFLSVEFIPIVSRRYSGFYHLEGVVDHLKDVKIRGFGGHRYEIVFVKFLLGNASVLEKMSIVPSRRLSKNSMLLMNIIQEIQRHPRSSTCSEVLFA